MKICRYVCILSTILIMTIFIITESSRAVKVGYDIANTEEKLERLLAENKNLEYKSDRLKTPGKIALRVKDMGLNLVMIDSNKGKKGIAVARNLRKYQNRNHEGKL